MGCIAALAMSTPNEQTPINKEIHHFILIISAIAISLGLLFFILNIIIGTPYIENLVFMIGFKRLDDLVMSMAQYLLYFGSIYLGHSRS